MATKKGRQRISYVVESPKASAGHKLGVNGLAVDADNSILYSGGRDGVICAWDLNLDLKRTSPAADPAPPSKTTFRSQARAHMAWVNDIVLAQNNSAVVSGSSDLTVKVWRPNSEEQLAPQTIGEHADYVKCVVAPPADMGAPWVASGGLDKRIYLWDLSGHGKMLSIDCSGEEKPEKGSVYALSAGRNIIANGGPESIVRLWDPKSGKRVSKFVGHTANIRSILISDDSDLLLTASSDQTVKLWSVTAGRCMYTFTMHNESVWSLFSESPDLGVFYSSDRSGLVVKTDVRGSLDHMDDGLSLAVAKETDAVYKVVTCRDHIWTATPSSSINRWANVPTGADIQLPEAYRHHQRASSAASRAAATAPRSPEAKPAASKIISPKSILRISNTAFYPPQLVKNEGALVDMGHEVEPIFELPEETIEGQFGLLKYKLMSDRRRVLTVDTAGEVVLWDLIQCKPVQSFGKRHLEDVAPEVNTVEAVAPWCSIDTSSGSITVTLDPFNCFDAEVYADELDLANASDFREDQRINLGKWILRYLFAGVIDEEIKRDTAHRKTLNDAVEKRIAAAKANPLPTLTIPLPEANTLNPELLTPRPPGQGPLPTPGLSIGLATPHPGADATPVPGRTRSQLTRSSAENDDYFASAISPIDGGALKQTATTATQGESGADSKSSEPDTDKDKDGKDGKDNGKDGKDGGKDKDKDKGENGKTPGTPFGKKFRMNMSFGTKKGRAPPAPEKPPATEEKPEEPEEPAAPVEKEVEDNLLGVVQRIRNEYDRQLASSPDSQVESRLAASGVGDTPPLDLPPGTKVIVKEETSGESSNVYVGTVDSAARDVDEIEQRGAMWLGELLLLGQVPIRDPVKVSFVLLPYGDELPGLSSADGNNRLNANRMLRVRKILGYVAEKLDLEYREGEGLRAEEYLDLYCNDQVLPHKMTLATLRAHVWKGGTDVVLHYRANGRKKLRLRDAPEAQEGDAKEGSGEGADDAV